MGNRFAALISGLVFGAGLTVSQMISPAKVLAFLDVAGAWDPSLGLVMAPAVTGLGLGYAGTFAFAASMIAGMILYRILSGGAVKRGAEATKTQ